VIAELLKVAQSTPVPGTRTFSAVLPTIDPEAADADAAVWCKTASMILCEHPQEGEPLVMTLSKSLLGNASQWLTQICIPGMSWAQLKELFMERYEGIETPAALLLNMLKGHPSSHECFSVYSSRLVTSLLTKWRAMIHEEIAVSLELAHTLQIDSRLQRLVFTFRHERSYNNNSKFTRSSETRNSLDLNKALKRRGSKCKRR